MPQWRWRYAAWWLGLVPLIWPLALFAEWMLLFALGLPVLGTWLAVRRRRAKKRLVAPAGA